MDNESFFSQVKKKLVKFSKGYYNYKKPSPKASHVSETFPKDRSLKNMFLNTKYNYKNMGNLKKD
jgi:hypothetical protein|tara:strand:+ start:6693 stop:6887 length:195 start_codon:yes stop_codon:yes gene_type:complete